HRWRHLYRLLAADHGQRRYAVFRRLELDSVLQRPKDGALVRRDLPERALSRWGTDGPRHERTAARSQDPRRGRRRRRPGRAADRERRLAVSVAWGRAPREARAPGKVSRGITAGRQRPIGGLGRPSQERRDDLRGRLGTIG